MNVLEAKLVMDSLGNLDQKLPREENAKTVNLPAFRELVEATRNIPGTETYRAKIEAHPYFQSKVAAAAVNEQSRQLIRDAVALRGFLRTIQTFLSAFESVSATESDIYVRFVKADDLPGLNQQMSTFQKILEQTILDSKISGKMELKTVEAGSVIVHLCLGSVAAVTLVGGIAWAAVVVFKKYQEARLVEVHVEGLEIKNDALDQIRVAQKHMLKQVVEAEARHLEKEAYDGEENPERLERIKHSIDLMQGLIERGTEVHPALLAPENVKNLFPDFKHLENVTSKIKQITEKASGS